MLVDSTKNNILGISINDWKKIFKGTAIASVGAGLTFLVQELGNYNFGDYQLIFTVVISVLTNVIRKYFSNKQN